MNNVLFVLLRRLHTPLIILISVYAVSVLGFVLIPGMDDQGQPWRMDFLHAFYFVSFMGTTIGFGEIPYAFTPAQRLWATTSLYATVISWLYGIGALFSLIQDPGFRQLLTESRFRRQVRRIHDPFYLVCGYGDTGSLLVKALTEYGIGAVVLEIKQERIHDLALADHRLFVPGLCADAAQPGSLMLAGLNHRHCVGIVALTNLDQVNLQIAISSKLLNPLLRTIVRAETRDAERNIASFGTEHIINPFDTFAGRLALALHSPGMYLLYEWMTSVPHEVLQEPLFPPRGRWVLCGYGRFGKAVYSRLATEGIETTVIEARPEKTGAPAGGLVNGRGTEAETLREADIQHATGLVAGTDDDANNLSIIMTARELNPDLFVVVRQNSRANDTIFRAADADLVVRRGSIIAHKIFALIVTPLLADFLKLARRYDDEWANQLVSRIGGITGDEAPDTWTLALDDSAAPAVAATLAAGQAVNVGDLYRDPRQRDTSLPVIVLLIKRGRQELMLPSAQEPLQAGDRLLLCSQTGAKARLQWLLCNINTLDYVLSGEERPAGYIWRRWMGRKGSR